MNRTIRRFLAAFVTITSLCLIAHHWNDDSLLLAMQGAISVLALKGATE